MNNILIILIKLIIIFM